MNFRLKRSARMKLFPEILLNNGSNNPTRIKAKYKRNSNQEKRFKHKLNDHRLLIGTCYFLYSYFLSAAGSFGSGKINKIYTCDQKNKNCNKSENIILQLQDLCLFQNQTEHADEYQEEGKEDIL